MFNMRRKWITSADAECGIAGKYETPQYDVRTEGVRGVPSEADIVSSLSKGGCVNLWTGGSINRKILRTSYMEALLAISRRKNGRAVVLRVQIGR